VHLASLHHNPTGPPAFSFDIDGVLIRGKQVLDATKKAMDKVDQYNTEVWKGLVGVELMHMLTLLYTLQLCPNGRWLFPTVFIVWILGLNLTVPRYQRIMGHVQPC
jgi:hypothetical protein